METANTLSRFSALVDTKVAGPNQYLYILINVLQRCSAIVLGEHPLKGLCYFGMGLWDQGKLIHFAIL